MKLQTRLRVFVLVLLIAVISVLSLLNLYSLGWAAFQDVLQRAEMSSQQVKSFLIQRLKELMADRPAPRTFEETKATWRGLVSSDDELALFLQNTTANSPVIVEIAVAGEGGHILADSSPSRVGRHAPDLPNLAKWAKRSAWGKLFEVFTERRDYEITVPLGVPGQQQPVFTVNVVLSSVLLRQLVLPQIQRIGLIFLGALLLSMVLSIVVSNLVMRPLHDISYAIDRISRGELAPTAIADGAGEFASMQSKLNLLGQQFYGARQDAVQLRGNIERLLARLEEVVFLFDRDDHLVMAGHDADRILGKGRWELLGRPLTAVFPLSSPIGAAIRHAIESREPIKDLPLTLEREEAPPIRLLVNVEMLEAFPDHQRIGTLIALRDAETRRQIQSQLDVSARLASISRLTGGVAHEIKNPLQAITVHLELLKSKLADRYEEVAPEIETIAREIQRLNRVVKTFLDFTRPIDLRMRDLEMVALAREITSLVAPSAARQDVTIEIAASPKEIFVNGDRDLIQQALLNVVMNGIESMKQGGRLRLAVESNNDECCVSVSDEGVGIAPEIRDKIFNLYYSTKGKGSGIGLAMTFRVVQLHNGTIDFTSEPGKGTTFRLRFPLLDKEGLRAYAGR